MARISTILHEQERAWNQADLAGFMAHYHSMDSITFISGGRMMRGWQSVMDRYQARYPDAQAMGRVRFSEIEVRILGRQTAVVVGRWTLAREQETFGGRFTLVFQKHHGTWGILHDHTSLDDPPEESSQLDHPPSRSYETPQLPMSTDSVRPALRCPTPRISQEIFPFPSRQVSCQPSRLSGREAQFEDSLSRLGHSRSPGIMPGGFERRSIIAAGLK